MIRLLAAFITLAIVSLPIVGAYKVYEYFDSGYRESQIQKAVKSATTGLKYIKAGEKGLGCLEMKYAYLRLVELDASEANEIKIGYEFACGSRQPSRIDQQDLAGKLNQFRVGY